MKIRSEIMLNNPKLADLEDLATGPGFFSILDLSNVFSEIKLDERMKAVKAITQILYWNICLDEVTLDDNYFSNEEAAVLAESFKTKKALVRLNLRNCQFESLGGIKLLFDILATLPSLKQVGVDYSLQANEEVRKLLQNYETLRGKLQFDQEFMLALRVKTKSIRKKFVLPPNWTVLTKFVPVTAFPLDVEKKFEKKI